MNLTKSSSYLFNMCQFLISGPSFSNFHSHKSRMRRNCPLCRTREFPSKESLCSHILGHVDEQEGVKKLRYQYMMQQQQNCRNSMTRHPDRKEAKNYFSNYYE